MQIRPEINSLNNNQKYALYLNWECSVRLKDSFEMEIYVTISNVK